MQLKKCIPVVGNIDPRQLVKATLWLAQQGVRPTSRNDLLVKCVQLVANQLVNEGPEPTLEQAHQFMDTKFPTRTYQMGRRAALPTVKLEAKSDEQEEFEKAQALAREFGRELTLEQFRANKVGGV